MKRANCGSEFGKFAHLRPAARRKLDALDVQFTAHEVSGKRSLAIKDVVALDAGCFSENPPPVIRHALDILRASALYVCGDDNRISGLRKQDETLKDVSAKLDALKEDVLHETKNQAEVLNSINEVRDILNALQVRDTWREAVNAMQVFPKDLFEP